MRGSGRGSGGGGGGGGGFRGWCRAWASFINFCKDTVESHSSFDTIALQGCSQVLYLVLQVSSMAVLGGSRKLDENEEKDQFEATSHHP